MSATYNQYHLPGSGWYQARYMPLFTDNTGMRYTPEFTQMAKEVMMQSRSNGSFSPTRESIADVVAEARKYAE